MTESTSSERGADVRFPPPLVYAIYALAGVVIHYAVAPAPVSIGRMLGLSCGIVVLMLGVAIIVSARTQYVRTGQHPAPWKPSPELILQGPYRFTRNPMYLGLTLIQLGLGFAVNNLWISASAPLSLLTVHFIAVLETPEQILAKSGED